MFSLDVASCSAGEPLAIHVLYQIVRKEASFLLAIIMNFCCRFKTMLLANNNTGKHLLYIGTHFFFDKKCGPSFRVLVAVDLACCLYFFLSSLQFIS